MRQPGERGEGAAAEVEAVELGLCGVWERAMLVISVRSSVLLPLCWRPMTPT